MWKCSEEGTISVITGLLLEMRFDFHVFYIGCGELCTLPEFLFVTTEIVSR